MVKLNRSINLAHSRSKLAKNNLGGMMTTTSKFRGFQGIFPHTFDETTITCECEYRAKMGKCPFRAKKLTFCPISQTN